MTSTADTEPLCVGPGYFREMLSQWLKWSPPNHPPPTVHNLASALRRIGEEATAFQLESDFGINGWLQRVCACSLQWNKWLSI